MVEPYTDELIYGSREAAGLKGYLTIREAATLFNKSVDTIERWTRSENPLPVHRFPVTGDIRFVRRSEIIDYMATHATRRRR